jgi:hypothetical protein
MDFVSAIERKRPHKGIWAKSRFSKKQKIMNRSISKAALRTLMKTAANYLDSFEVKEQNSIREVDCFRG